MHKLAAVILRPCFPKTKFAVQHVSVFVASHFMWPMRFFELSVKVLSTAKVWLWCYIKILEQRFCSFCLKKKKRKKKLCLFLVLAEKVILLLHVLQALVSLMSVIKEHHSISCSFLNQFSRCFVSLYVFGIRVVCLG